MATNGSSTSRFPSAYVNSVNENDSVVIRVDQDNGTIGSRPATMPTDVRAERMSIRHVGDAK